jgi:hypothetical protein
MGKRSGKPDQKAEVAKLTLGQLNSEIERCSIMSDLGGSSQGRKAFFDRLVWYEKMREELHGIPAPRRRARRKSQ